VWPVQLSQGQFEAQKENEALGSKWSQTWKVIKSPSGVISDLSRDRQEWQRPGRFE
jgi:hypothetical protein